MITFQFRKGVYWLLLFPDHHTHHKDDQIITMNG